MAFDVLHWIIEQRTVGSPLHESDFPVRLARFPVNTSRIASHRIVVTLIFDGFQRVPTTYIRFCFIFNDHLVGTPYAYSEYRWGLSMPFDRKNKDTFRP